MSTGENALPQAGLLRELRAAIQAWCRREGLSREDAATAIIQQHYGAGFDQSSGIVFDEVRNGKPSSERARRTAADRIFRWLDDETKNRNLLPASFLPSILLALPEEDSLLCVNAILSPLRLEAFSRLPARKSRPEDLKPAEMLREMLLKTGDAEKSLAEMLDGIDPGELQAARNELRGLLDTTRQVLARIESCLA